jgi:hypothetical protein
MEQPRGSLDSILEAIEEVEEVGLHGVDVPVDSAPETRAARAAGGADR